jgi:uncharacterized protein (UPF0335 family)
MAEGQMIDRDALNRYVSRVLRLHEERAALNADISSVYEEAKNAGFVTKIVRQIVREQQMEADERESHYALLDSYRAALGMLADTPLGAAAMRQAERTTAPRPKPFAEQPITRGRGRPRKDKAGDAMTRAREHLGIDEAPAGSA